MHIGVILFGVILIIISVLEFVETRRMVHRLQTEGGKDTSSFIGYALWSAVVVGIFLAITGVAVIVLFH